MAQDWIADSFEPTRAVPVNHDEPWETIPYFYGIFAPQLLLGIFPSHLQIDTRFYRSVRALGVSSLTVAQEQMQAGISLIDELPIGGIVLTLSAFDDATKNISALAQEINLYMQIVLSPIDTLPTIRRENTFLEIHGIPGSPLLFQCAHLALSRDFHPTTRFVKDAYPSSCTVRTSLCDCGALTRVHID